MKRDSHNLNLGFSQLKRNLASTAQITTVLTNHHDQNEHQITQGHQTDRARFLEG